MSRYKRSNSPDFVFGTWTSLAIPAIWSKTGSSLGGCRYWKYRKIKLTTLSVKHVEEISLYCFDDFTLPRIQTPILPLYHDIITLKDVTMIIQIIVDNVVDLLARIEPVRTRMS